MGRSTGPTSSAGKAHSAQNARKHGLRATKTVAPDEEEAVESLVRDLELEYGPPNATVSLTIERVAMDMTRLRNLDVMENAMFAAARIQVTNAKRDGAPQFKWVPDALLQAAAVPPLNPWRLLHRYQTELNRRISKGLGELIALRERARTRDGASGRDSLGAANTRTEVTRVKGNAPAQVKARRHPYSALSGKWLPPNQAEALSGLLATLRTEYSPGTATEHILIERLAMAMSKRRRVYLLQEDVRAVAQLHAKRMHERGHQRFAGMDAELAQAIAVPEVQLWDLLVQHEGALDREISRTTGELMHIQDAAAATSITDVQVSRKRLVRVRPV
jgi:hypothetical protein